MGTCERRLRLDVPADVAWEWMKEPRNLFSVNIFHAEVEFDEPELRAGSVVHIAHDFFGAYKQQRQAKVREFRDYFIAFGEHKSPDAPGRDPFPHNQSFEVVPIDEHSCEIVNTLTGRYVFPGAKYVGERLFRRYMPVILDDDNQVIAVGCGAMPPTKVKVPKGLLLWPLMAAAGRLTKKSTRRDVLAAKRSQAAKHTERSSGSSVSAS
jgi:hypothetical protein